VDPSPLLLQPFISLLCHHWMLYSDVRFEVFTAVTMKNAVFWDVTPCGSCNNRRFGRTQHLHHPGDKNRRARKNVNRNSQPTYAAKKYLIDSDGCGTNGGMNDRQGKPKY
jgi:hypothetical protein